MKKYYIIQEKLCNYEYCDVYESDDLNLIYKFKITLQNKYPSKNYRIVEVVYV